MSTYTQVPAGTGMALLVARLDTASPLKYATIYYPVGAQVSVYGFYRSQRMAGKRVDAFRDEFNIPAYVVFYNTFDGHWYFVNDTPQLPT